VSSTPASTLPGASNLVDEASHAVRARTAYNNVGLASEYWEGTSTNKEGAVQSLTHVHDINYNALGQQVKTISDLHKIGLDLDLFQTLQRDGMAYNSFGQIIGYVDHTTQNGLNVVTTVMDITYDREGRITSSKSVTNKQGEELQTFYTVGGNDLTPVQLAAFLEAHPGKTVADLVTSGALKFERRKVAVNETVISVTSDLKYNKLNRVLSSKETVYNTDGTTSVNVLSELEYDAQGRLVASQMSNHQFGPSQQMIYHLDGVELDAQDLATLLKNEDDKENASTTGATFWDLLESGRLTVETVDVQFDKTTSTSRTNMRYNENGQLAHYRDESADPENRIEKQVNNVDVTYTMRGFVHTQTTSSRIDNTDGGWTESTGVLTFHYDAATDLLLGAESHSTFTTQPPQVWTDENQDGEKDTLVWLPPVTGASHQTFGAVNGQIRLLNQISEQDIKNIENANGLTHSVTQSVYQYNAKGRLLGSVSSGQTVGNDGFGNLNEGRLQQLSVVINGEMKTIISHTDSTAKTAEGSENRSVTDLIYTYDALGHVTGAAGRGWSEGQDRGWSDPEHLWHDGWVDANKNGKVDTGEIDNDAADGVVQDAEIEWVDANGNGIADAGRVVDTGSSTGSIVQDYAVFDRDVRLIRSTTTTRQTTTGDNETEQSIVTEYTYDSAGRMTGASSQGETYTLVRGWSDTTVPPDGVNDEVLKVGETIGTFQQTFLIIKGNAKVWETVSTNETMNINGSQNIGDMTTTYSYNQNGLVTGAVGRGHSQNIDVGWTDTDVPPDGEVDELIVTGQNQSTITQEFRVINGQAKVYRTVTDTLSVDPNTGQPIENDKDHYNHSISTVVNVYDAVGRLVAADGNTVFDSTALVASQPGSDTLLENAINPPPAAPVTASAGTAGTATVAPHGSAAAGQRARTPIENAVGGDLPTPSDEAGAQKIANQELPNGGTRQIFARREEDGTITYRLMDTFLDGEGGRQETINLWRSDADGNTLGTPLRLFPAVTRPAQTEGESNQIGLSNLLDSIGWESGNPFAYRTLQAGTPNITPGWRYNPLTRSLERLGQALPENNRLGLEGNRHAVSQSWRDVAVTGLVLSGEESSQRLNFTESDWSLLLGRSGFSRGMGLLSSVKSPFGADGELKTTSFSNGRSIFAQSNFRTPAGSLLSVMIPFPSSSRNVEPIASDELETHAVIRLADGSTLR
ncbi:MAG TPA: hypothetical protein PKZ00_02845, partial [Elusimicrobiota bacterium]|nr:hypothetical protein [Elusimicrobiota bacterium]